MTHATYIWVLLNMSMYAFIEYGYGSRVGMGSSTLHQVIFRHPYLTQMQFDFGNF